MLTTEQNPWVRYYLKSQICAYSVTRESTEYFLGSTAFIRRRKNIDQQLCYSKEFRPASKKGKLVGRVLMANTHA